MQKELPSACSAPGQPRSVSQHLLMPANSAARKRNFFSPAAETTVLESLAKEMPSVSRHPMVRARLLSTCREAGGREGSWEALVNVAGK